MDDAECPRLPLADETAGPAGRGVLADAPVPLSLTAYIATRAEDPGGAIRSLAGALPHSGLWTPVVGPIATTAGLAPCRFDAALLLRRERGGMSAVIAARRWSVTLSGVEAWIDVEWPSDAWAGALVGRRVRSQIDFPFLSEALIVRGSESLAAFRRFHCIEDADDLHGMEEW